MGCIRRHLCPDKHDYVDHDYMGTHPRTEYDSGWIPGSIRPTYPDLIVRASVLGHIFNDKEKRMRFRWGMFFWQMFATVVVFVTCFYFGFSPMEAGITSLVLQFVVILAYSIRDTLLGKR